VIDRSYVTLDTGALQHSLLIGDVTTVAQKAMRIVATSVLLADGSTVSADTVVDASGLIAPSSPAQSAYGVVMDSAVAATYLGDDSAVLMDWRGAGRSDAPSFLYTIPLGAGQVLLEETCLAGAPPIAFDELRIRLVRRLSEAGVSPSDIADSRTERVWFALRSRTDKPWRDDTLHYGAAGGLMHPATGYSVATSLRESDVVVNAIMRQQDPRRALWPAQARVVHRLRTRGLNSLLGLDPVEVVEFFDRFFDMSIERQRTYLSSRSDPAGVASAMARAVAGADRGLAVKIMRGALVRHK
jgi:lycopene beta-cyclase